MSAEGIIISTKEKVEFIDITNKIEKIVSKKKIKNGICHIFILHSSCGLMINENEPLLRDDYVKFVKKLTAGEIWGHDKVNSARDELFVLNPNTPAHLVAGLLGQNKTLFIVKGKLLLGTFQRIFLVELDGPRERNIVINITHN